MKRVEIFDGNDGKIIKVAQKALRENGGNAVELEVKDTITVSKPGSRKGNYVTWLMKVKANGSFTLSVIDEKNSFKIGDIK